MGPEIGVSKGAEDTTVFRRPLFRFARARDAFAAMLRAIGFEPGEVVLLPAYIGSSAREGCWALDALGEVDGRTEFYRVTDALDVDLGDFISKLKSSRPRAAVATHFFGYKSHLADRALRIARTAGAVTVEDCAHALLTDWVAGKCGRTADAALYSFHKILPLCSGGGVMLNLPALPSVEDQLSEASEPTGEKGDLLSYDYWSIARARRRNARDLLRLLQPHRDLVVPLYERLPFGVVPQSLPVLIKGGGRDQLYEEMNSVGFGAVSLYHTLAPGISGSLFSPSLRLSRQIFNLPVHQDATHNGLISMVEYLVMLLRRGNGPR
jgi:hypothetical protein